MIQQLGETTIKDSLGSIVYSFLKVLNAMYSSHNLIFCCVIDTPLI